MSGDDYIWIFWYGAIWLAIGYGCYRRGKYLYKDGRRLQAVGFWLLAIFTVVVVAVQALIQTLWAPPEKVP